MSEYFQPCAPHPAPINVSSLWTIVAAKRKAAGDTAGWKRAKFNAATARSAHKRCEHRKTW